MKKKSKISIVLIVLLIILIAAAAIGCLIKFDIISINDLPIVNNLISDKKLSGEKLIDGVYHYDLEIGDYNYDVGVIDGNFYYTVDEDEVYQIYKRDIYKTNNEKIKTLNVQNSYCYISDDFIYDSDYDTTRIYNYKLNKIYDGEYKNVLPYKDGYCKFDGNKVYYNDKEYKTIDKDLTGYNIYDHQTFDNNMYIYFGNVDGDRLIYNLEKNTFEDFGSYDGIKKYSNGLYYWTRNNIYVTNLDNDEIKKYDNPLMDESLIACDVKDNMLYSFEKDYLVAHNLENGKINLLDYRINKRVDDIVIKGNLLYLLTGRDAYVFDLNVISFDEMTTDEFEAKLEDRLQEKIKTICDKYGIEIKIREEADLNFENSESTIGETDYDTINDQLDDIDEVFSRFGKAFFTKFVRDDFTGLSVYMVDKIYNDDFSMAGEEIKYYDKFTLVCDSSDFKRTLCHELMHALEDTITFVTDNEMFGEWSNYNPEGFEYTNEHDSPIIPEKYSNGNIDADVYFVDNYAQVDELEDRARIFENILMDTTDCITLNPYLLKKAQYMVKEILRYYPMLENTDIFNKIV